MATLEPIDVIGGAVRVAGIVELEPTAGGIVLHRMPAWARAQHNDIALSLLETMPSGGRMEMVTDATCLELDVQLTLRAARDRARAARRASTLVVDGEHAGAESTRTGTLIVIDPRTGAVDFQPGGPATIRFDGLPAGEKHVEVWLPHAAAVHLIELRADGAVAAPEPTGPAVGPLRQLDLPLPRSDPTRPASGRRSRPASPASTCRASRSPASASSTRSPPG